MSPSPPSLYRRIFFGTARVYAFLLMIFTAVGAIGLIRYPSPQLDPGLKWGLVGLMVVLFVLSILMLRAPTRRQP
jgi:hypothetical protein